MSINNNQNHNIDMPTISTFLSDLRYLLKLDIKQNKQVEIAKSIQQKITRFNTLINSKDDPSEELGTLDKIVSRLSGISKFTKNHKKYLNNTEKNALTCYKKVIETQYQLIEIMIPSLKNQFLFHPFQSTEEKKSLFIKHLVIPLIILTNDIGEHLPSFVPLNYLSDIATIIYLYKREEKDTVNIIQKYLRHKIDALLKRLNENTKKTNVIDAKEVLFGQIKDIDFDSITSPQSIDAYTQNFLAKLNVKEKKYNESILYEFNGAYHCAMYILRLKKLLEGEVVFSEFIQCLVTYTWVYQAQNYSNQTEKKHKLTIKIKDCDLKQIAAKLNLRDNEYLDVDKILKDNLTLFKQYVRYFTYEDLSIKKCVDATNALVSNIKNYQSPFSFELTDFLNNGIQSNSVKNEIALLTWKNEFEQKQDCPYQLAVVYFIESILALKKEDLDKAIKYSELVINEDVKKWHIGKIYSDALVIYIGTSMMKGSLRPKQLLTYFKQYHEVAYPILAFSKPQIDYINEKSIDEFIKAINVKSLILNFHQFSIKINKQDYLQQLNTNILPQNFGEIELVDIDLPFKDDEELFVI